MVLLDRLTKNQLGLAHKYRSRRENTHMMFSMMNREAEPSCYLCYLGNGGVSSPYNNPVRFISSS